MVAQNMVPTCEISWFQAFVYIDSSFFKSKTCLKKDFLHSCASRSQIPWVRLYWIFSGRTYFDPFSFLSCRTWTLNLLIMIINDIWNVFFFGLIQSISMRIWNCGPSLSWPDVSKHIYQFDRILDRPNIRQMPCSWPDIPLNIQLDTSTDTINQN